MGRYFFHVEDGVHFTDDEGTEFSSGEAARAAAVQHLADMMKDRSREFWNHPYLKLTVTDARGLALFTLEVDGALAPAGR